MNKEITNYGTKYYYKLLKYYKKNKELIEQSLNKRAEFSNYYKNLVLPNIINDNKFDFVNKMLKLPNYFINNLKEFDEEIYFNNGCLKEEKSYISFMDYIKNNKLKVNCGRILIFDDKLLKLYKELQEILYKKVSNYNFKYIFTSLIINEQYLTWAGQLPKLKDTMFELKDKIYCIPTSEVAIFQEIVDNYKHYFKKADSSYVKLFSNSKCFRNENSNSSVINKPLIRQDIFTKVETFILCKSDESMNAFEYLKNIVKEYLQNLEFQFKIIKVGYKNMSHSAYLQYDFEIFFPGTKKWIEICSLTNCWDYQLTRCDNIIDKKYNEKYHTLNCSMLPIERLIAAFIEYNKI